MGSHNDDESMLELTSVRSRLLDSFGFSLLDLLKPNRFDLVELFSLGDFLSRLLNML